MSGPSKIVFSRPHITGRELDLIASAIATGRLAGDGDFTRWCENRLAELIGGRAFLTNFGTAALEMAAILAGIGSGHEVIMPSFTFVSTANVVVLRGATPVFVDIEPATLNIDPGRIEAAITERTRAIFAVHYAGVAADMDAIAAIAARHGLIVVEDAAQA